MLIAWRQRRGEAARLDLLDSVATLKWPTVANLHEDTGRPYGTVSNHIEAMYKKGWLRRKKTTQPWKPWGYRLTQKGRRAMMKMAGSADTLNRPSATHKEPAYDA